jgi:hypothetical protein
MPLFVTTLLLVIDYNLTTEQDLRNHGESDHAPQHDYLAMAADVTEFIAKHRLSKPVLIGHSMFVL